MSIIDHKCPEPLLEQVRILPLGQVELGIQGDCFDPVAGRSKSAQWSISPKIER